MDDINFDSQSIDLRNAKNLISRKKSFITKEHIWPTHTIKIGNDLFLSYHNRWDEYLGILLLNEKQLSLHYKEISPENIILDNKDSFKQNMPIFYDIPSFCINFKGSFFLYQRLNPDFGLREQQVFIYDNINSLKQKKFVKFKISGINEYIYYSYYSIFDDIMYCIALTYKGSKSHAHTNNIYMDMNLNIYSSKNGIDFKFIKEIGKFLDLGHVIKLIKLKNKFVCYTGILSEDWKKINLKKTHIEL